MVLVLCPKHLLIRIITKELRLTFSYTICFFIRVQDKIRYTGNLMRSINKMNVNRKYLKNVLY
jgi:hypothetical protein